MKPSQCAGTVSEHGRITEDYIDYCRQELHAVAMQAYVEGVSTRWIDDLVIVLGGA